METDDLNMQYGKLCATLGDLVIRGEINYRQMEETKEKLHKLQVKGKKEFLKQQSTIKSDGVQECPDQQNQ